MLRSLRARLLAWYSFVLLAVLVAFSAIAAWSVWRSSVRDLDARLQASASLLAQALSSDAAGQYEVNLAGDDFAQFSETEGAPYYAIWSPAGALIDRSDLTVDAAFPGTPQLRSRNGRREVVVRGDGDVLVLVGQSLAGPRADLWAATVRLGAAAAVALLIASIGGSLVVGGALAPIGRIAQTAEAMSESNLGLRIDIDRTEDELGAVAVALNRAFDRLQEAFERQARFTADASHELRTPLASQLAELEWALAKSRSNSEYEDSLGVCMRAAQRMRAVVEGLLTLAKADAGAVELQRRPVDLLALAHDVAAGIETAAAERGIGVHVDGPAVVVAGDPDRLRELVANLVSNAVQYGARGDRVTCSVSAAGDKATLEVADTGPGIDAEDLPHVFERFYRANRARSRAAGGAGLGLAISKWIAESHGGEIRCQSARGQGTRFTLELPVNDRAGEPAAVRHADTRLISRGSMKVDLDARRG